MDLNRVMILGRLTHDPEFRKAASGRGRAAFAVATNRQWVAEGKVKRDAQYHQVVAWGTLAELVDQWLHKGNRVYLDGHLRTGSWKTKTGEPRRRSEVVAEQIIFLDSPTAKGEAGGAAAEPEAVAEEAAAE